MAKTFTLTSLHLQYLKYLAPSVAEDGSFLFVPLTEDQKGLVSEEADNLMAPFTQVMEEIDIDYFEDMKGEMNMKKSDHDHLLDIVSELGEAAGVVLSGNVEPGEYVIGQHGYWEPAENAASDDPSSEIPATEVEDDAASEEAPVEVTGGDELF